MQKVIVLFGLLTVVIIAAIYKTKTEGFASSSVLAKYGSGSFPDAVSSGLLSDTYPIGKSNGAMWWMKPVSQVGSYKQITNNLKYYRNPDIGTCTPNMFCGVMYKDRVLGSNCHDPLGPAPDCDVRINYYVTDTRPLL